MKFLSMIFATAAAVGVNTSASTQDDLEAIVIWE